MMSVIEPIGNNWEIPFITRIFMTGTIFMLLSGNFPILCAIAVDLALLLMAMVS
jgi:hypothetical protein